MRRQTYLIRKGARYHFRRRYESNAFNCPITVSLGTADPGEARRLASRLAVIWDETTMHMQSSFQRGTLTIEERETIYKNALKEELAHATAHKISPVGSSSTHPSLHKIMAAAYRIVLQMPHDAKGIDAEVIESAIDDSWSDSDFMRLIKTLKFVVTPMAVSLSDAKDALDELGIAHNEAILGDARSQKLRGFAEAHDRAALLDHPVIKTSGKGVMALLDDDVISRALQQINAPKTAGPQSASVQMENNPETQSVFLRPSNQRFSEIIDPTLASLFAQNKWKPDKNQRKSIAERFAWITGDKIMTEYFESDIQDYVDALNLIPTNFKFGHLGKSGAMAKPFDPSTIPALTPETARNGRTINRDLSVLQKMSKHLAKSHWRPKYGKALEMDFLGSSVRIEVDPWNPERMPWTPKHLKTMFSLPLWQGSGGTNERMTTCSRPVIYQDAAYWAPLIATYTGMGREEVCGLEIQDFEFCCDIPYLIVQSNMTRSQDGINPGGLKRLARHRVMPLHSELLRLGLGDYVQSIEGEKNGFSEKSIDDIWNEARIKHD